MSVAVRRAPRPESVTSAILDLLDEGQTPLPTRSVRILLGDRGRPVTAEHLGRVAAYERDAYLRTLMPPRLCSAIDPSGRLVTPRWWARGDWRLQRRILTPDVKSLWLARLADRLCWDLSRRDRAASPDVQTLALWAVAKVVLERHFETPQSRDDWAQLRALVVEKQPGVTHSLDGATGKQAVAEEQLIAANLPAVERYFGAPRQRRG